jgi:hypothetical protein
MPYGPPFVPTDPAQRPPSLTRARLASDGYPDDWVPVPGGDGYPDDWIALPSPAPSTPQPARSPQPISASPTVSNRPAPPLDPFSDYWSRIPASSLTQFAWKPPIFPDSLGRYPLAAPARVTMPQIDLSRGMLGGLAHLLRAPAIPPPGLLGGLLQSAPPGPPASQFGLFGSLVRGASEQPPSPFGGLARLSSVAPSSIDAPSAPFPNDGWIGPAPGVFPYPDPPGWPPILPNSLGQLPLPAPAPRAVLYMDAPYGSLGGVEIASGKHDSPLSQFGLLGGTAGLSDQPPSLPGGSARLSSAATSSIDNPSAPFLKEPWIGPAPGVIPYPLEPATDAEPTSPGGSEGFPTGARAASQPMPGLLGALGQGFVSGTHQLDQTLQSYSSAPPVAVVDQSPAAQPIQLSDLSSPWSQLAPKVAFRFAQSYPTLAGGVAGGLVGGGIGTVGGPVGGTIGAIGGGAAGAGLASAIQTLGPAFAAELQKSPTMPKARGTGRGRRRKSPAHSPVHLGRPSRFVLFKERSSSCCSKPLASSRRSLSASELRKMSLEDAR